MSKRTMSDEHREALSVGRARGRAVRNYLEALESHRPKRGRRRTPETMRARITEIDNEMGTATPMQRLHLTQEKMDLAAKIEAAETTVNISALEDEFVDVAGAYGESNGISYAAWRAVGVPAAILKRAGVSRST
ncbi:MAG: hypothetical protein F4Y27_02965 [Acidimicrobiaceae bacterium]|nr:hypothetical protein [Acidimicrobiaceae bacterium]MXW62815.1 hypothetical protein [Acidimicrobiaceae bacterium]MXW76612.1 hypothetical protein [Acidimicrobiaceae bacterium]MYA73626.1 hypothetical protein [Acidimicrobiaceae bacterium]MYC42805.1 hypothetical protein [Acidimicrobiaceae bacterium]